MAAVRVTTNNARAGKNGVFMAKHLDGPDGKAAKMGGLLYTWHCDPDKGKDFEQVEADFYEAHFRAGLDAQNERHRKAGHKSRMKTMDEYRTAKNTCPESTLFYLGDKDQNVGHKVLQKVVVEFWKWRKVKFPNVRSLDLALHIEDGAPHIHEHHVWIAHDKDGNEIVNQEQALKEMGVKPPKKGKIDRFNNAKMTYTEMCREKMIEIARSYGIEITTEPREAGKKGQAQAKFITQDEQQKAAEAIAKAQEAIAEAQEAQEITQAEMRKLENVSEAIFNAQREKAGLEREIGDMQEYKAWKAQKAAQERQEAEEKARAEQEDKERREADRKAREAAERERKEREAQDARRARTEVMSEDEMIRAFRERMGYKDSTPQTVKPEQPKQEQPKPQGGGMAAMLQRVQSAAKQQPSPDTWYPGS